MASSLSSSLHVAWHPLVTMFGGNNLRMQRPDRAPLHGTDTVLSSKTIVSPHLLGSDACFVPIHPAARTCGTVDPCPPELSTVTKFQCRYKSCYYIFIFTIRSSTCDETTSPFASRGGSVLLMAAKAEVVEKQISPSAAQRSADLLPLRRCEARRRES